MSGIVTTILPPSKTLTGTLATAAKRMANVPVGGVLFGLATRRRVFDGMPVATARAATLPNTRFISRTATRTAFASSGQSFSASERRRFGVDVTFSWPASRGHNSSSMGVTRACELRHIVPVVYTAPSGRCLSRRRPLYNVVNALGSKCSCFLQNAASHVLAVIIQVRKVPEPAHSISRCVDELANTRPGDVHTGSRGSGTCALDLEMR